MLRRIAADIGLALARRRCFFLFRSTCCATTYLKVNNWPSGVVLTKNIHTSKLLEKYNRKSTQDDSDDENSDDEDFKDERDSKVIKTTVNSLRADLLLKAGLGMARNKVENAFYSSKIRVNGQKLAKKSEVLRVDDEIDVIRGFSQTNPSHLVIARVVLLAVNDREEGYSVTLRRYKSLLIENYAGANVFKSSETVGQ